MAYDLDRLKNEIQTTNGLLAKIKENQMPRKHEMADLALARYENTYGRLNKEYVKSHFSELLKKLIQIEFELYKEYEERLLRTSLKYFVDNDFKSNNNYPELQKLFTDLESKFSVSSNQDFKALIGQITVDLFPAMNLVTVSAHQGRRCRAGGSLENHLENLFRILDFRFETQKKIEGAVLDFVFPSLDFCIRHPQDSLILCSQTTLKDRFRLAVGQVPAVSSAKKFIVTATGAGIMTSRDTGDLPTDKLTEISSNGFRVIVFDDVKAVHGDNNAIISYSDFVQRYYPSTAALW
jgi:hypothetical protein